MRIRRLVFVASALVLLPACSAGKGGSATLPPLPISPPTITVAVPTSITISVTAAPAPSTIATTLPTSTALAAAQTSTATIPTTATPVTSTTLGAPSTTTTTVRPTDGSVPGSEFVDTWIMQLAAAPAESPDGAIDAQLKKLVKLTADATILNSADFPAAFEGPARAIFYVGGFASRDAVIAECARLELAYPANCLARLLSGA